MSDATASSVGAGRPARADARRNRARVLAAAEEVLARDGLSASMRAVAERAGVGLGTIYRHFPTQEALYQAIMVERMGRLAAEARAATTSDDPGTAFFDVFTRIVESSGDKKALADALSDAGIDPKAGLAPITTDLIEVLEILLDRARAAGAVRADLTMPELLALLAAVSHGAERGQWPPPLLHRTLTLVFDGLRR